FSNTHRRHSALGYLSPAAYERRWTLSQQVTSVFAVHQTGATPVHDEFGLVDWRRQANRLRPPSTVQRVASVGRGLLVGC
ncbi:MAG: hypothetical protein M3Q71_12215, partial [Chloroflexota bacterium]|nr:hypothetical protein [Chloroflexota bacterium]